jgi:hypothetical protein
MMVVGAFALLLLTAAVVVLYAMMGELASRIPDPEGGSDQVAPLTEVQRGAAAAHWPGGLAELAGRGRATLLVLSPICSTCNKVAAELSSQDADAPGVSLGVVVSCSTRQAGDEFVQKYSLARLPHLVDEGGSWVTGTFGVTMSPSALLLEKGVLTEAYTFSKVEALLEQVGRVSEGVS